MSNLKRRRKMSKNSEAGIVFLFLKLFLEREMNKNFKDCLRTDRLPAMLPPRGRSWRRGQGWFPPVPWARSDTVPTVLPEGFVQHLLSNGEIMPSPSRIREHVWQSLLMSESPCSSASGGWGGGLFRWLVLLPPTWGRAEVPWLRSGASLHISVSL